MITKAEKFALGNTLADYPEGISYEAVQSLINNRVLVSIWEPMTYWSDRDVTDFQDSLRDQIDALLAEVKS